MFEELNLGDLRTAKKYQEELVRNLLQQQADLRAELLEEKQRLRQISLEITGREQFYAALPYKR